MRCSTLLLGAMILIVALLGIAGSTHAAVVPPGFDLFATSPGLPPSTGTWCDLPFTLSPGFFGTISGQPSDPVPAGTRLFLKGKPTGPLGHAPDDFTVSQPPDPPGLFDEQGLLARHRVGDARKNGGVAVTDTIVRRLAPANLPGVGSMDTIPIEIISLSLQSVQPIQVTYGGGAFVSFFDVFVALAPIPQATGSMTLTRTSADGGVFHAVLPVRAMITFQNTNPSGPPAAQPLLFQDTFDTRPLQPDGVRWVIPEPATALVGLVTGAAIFCRKRRRT